MKTCPALTVRTREPLLRVSALTSLPSLLEVYNCCRWEQMRSVLQRLFLIGTLTADMFWSPMSECLIAQADLVPKDFIGENVPISLTIPFEVLINGRRWQGHTIGWHIDHPADTRSAIWLGLPGRGMYILSLDPLEGHGFQKAGAIHANVITFHDGGNQYEIRTSGPILASDGTWTLYLLHRSDMEMKGPLFGVDRIGSCTLGFLK
jgi:hypothetical protein